MARGKLIHVMGTQSNAGKTTIAIALCRIFSNMGYKVSPFKAMNMSLNSISTAEGYEISRSQWLQSKAARISPDWRVNPVLLKPEGAGTSQVIFKGKSIGSRTIKDYGEFMKEHARNVVKLTLLELLEQYDIVIAEGSGSAAEVNLFDRDLSNTWLTDACGGIGILVGNIENGGVFASLVGTKELSQFPDVFKYFIINNMFGRSDMLRSGIELVAQRTGMSCLGIIPHTDIKLPGEDSVDYRKDFSGNVGIIAYPHFENYSDLDPLRAMGMGKYIKKPDDMKHLRSIILPGSKDVYKDMAFLRENGLDREIINFASRGGKILGICGGYQLLSRKIYDQDGVQMLDKCIDGLGLLNVDFSYSKYKTVKQVDYNGKLGKRNVHGTGYEIHYGEVMENNEKGIFEGGYPVSSINTEGNVLGTNVHGLMENESVFHWITGKKPGSSYNEQLERGIKELSDHILATIKLPDIL